MHLNMAGANLISTAVGIERRKADFSPIGHSSVKASWINTIMRGSV